MRLSIVAVSSREPEWVKHACAAYLKRLPNPVAPKIFMLPPERGDNAKQREKLKIMKKISPGDNIVALDQHGEPWDTHALTNKLNDWMTSNNSTSFIIGGPDGLSADCRAAANSMWSLSSLTLPHSMARVILLEQLYRAWSILQNHPYHRE